jgi:hypothetical protein
MDKNTVTQSLIERAEQCRKEQEATVAKLEDFSFDDLHLMATGEFQNDPAAEHLLHLMYSFLRSKYIETLLQLRSVREVNR